MELKKEIFKEIGLNERESKTYLALLEMGSTTTGPLVEKTKIPASKIYEVLKRLEEKGFVNHLILKNQKHFQASSPLLILDQLENKYNHFKKYVSKLEELRKFSKKKQYAEYYQGNKAIFSLLRHLIKQAGENEDYFNFSFDDELKDEIFFSFFSNIAYLAYEKNLNIKMLSPKNKKKMLLSIFDKDFIKITNNKFTNNSFPEGLIIISNNVILIEYKKEPSAVRIESENHAQNFKNFFLEVYNKS